MHLGAQQTLCFTKAIRATRLFTESAPEKVGQVNSGTYTAYSYIGFDTAPSILFPSFAKNNLCAPSCCGFLQQDDAGQGRAAGRNPKNLSPTFKMLLDNRTAPEAG